MAEGATEGVPPTMRFFFPDDGVVPSMADGSFVSLPASWSVESAAGTENRYAAPPQPQRLESVREAVTESVGEEATHTVARSGATLTVVASGPTRIAPVDRTPVKSVPCENTSSSAMEHECSLAEALAAAPSSLGLLSDEESQRTAAPLSRFSDAEETKPDDMPARFVADHSYPQPEMLDGSIARGVAEVEAMVTLTHSRQPSQRVPPASLPHSSHLPDGAPAAAVVPATPSLPRKPPTPLTPPPSVPCRPEAPLPIRMPGSDATSVALRKAIEEAEEVWTHGLDTECISNPEGRSAETGMSSISTTSSSSSDAVFFAEVTQLQQQAARLTEDSARSAASLQALTSGLLRILGPHAALSSLVGEQYSKTPLVHLSWFLIAVLEGLLNNNADADDEGGAALKQIEVAEKQPAAPRPCSDAAEIGSSGGHAV
ncbi:hypothetical protein, conserved [Leishmania lindenbergi]|uniref:Uncharacterized protein n=1 Tax=Leishmania lindenbergi TaxID=651832 RepID=A0AAW2ZZT9_9TRYP